MRAVGGRWSAPERIALVVGLAVLAAALAVTLSHVTNRAAGSNNVIPDTVVAETHGKARRICQDHELLPADTAAMRISIRPTSDAGPAVRVSALQDGRPVATGVRAAGWSEVLVTVPLRTAARRDADVQVCVTLGSGQSAEVLGAATLDEPSATRLSGRVRIAYLRAGSESWWALAPTVVDRIGRAHGHSGSWIVAVAGLLAIASTVLVVRQIARESS